MKIHSGTFQLNGAGAGNSNAVLWIEGGTFGGAGILSLDGPLQWSGGTITGAVQCAGGILPVSASVTLDGGRLINTGVLTVLGSGTLWMGNGAVISNLVGATIDLAGDFSFASLSGSSTIWNVGLFRKSGSGTAYIGRPLNNTGTLLVDGGTLDLRRALNSNGGANTVLAPGVLTFGVGGGSHMLDAASSHG